MCLSTSWRPSSFTWHNCEYCFCMLLQRKPFSCWQFRQGVRVLIELWGSATVCSCLSFSLSNFLIYFHHLSPIHTVITSLVVLFVHQSLHIYMNYICFYETFVMLVLWHIVRAVGGGYVWGRPSVSLEASWAYCINYRSTEDGFWDL